MAKAASSPNGAKSGSHATSSGTTAPTRPKPSAARAVALVGAADFRAGDHEQCDTEHGDDNAQGCPTTDRISEGVERSGGDVRGDVRSDGRSEAHFG
ncbi:MAG: hypothetical protein QOJ28_2086 [Mycobacterium sp.]|nr:hypothetical protein [Mycobacterium sp.]